MSIWTLSCSAGAYTSWTDISTRPISNLRRVLVSQAPDRLSFDYTALYDADAVFPYGSTLSLRRDSTTVFVGLVQEPTRSADGATERLSYLVLGPWHNLAQCVYLQSWKEWDTGSSALVSASRSRVILGQSAAGAAITTGAQITDALNACIARYTADGQAAPFAIGTIDPAAYFPWSEERDVMCAEVIQRCLRHHPDAVTWFDYSTSPPTFHCRTRANLTAVSIPASAAGGAAALNIVARRDLQVSGVRCRFESTHEADGNTYSTLTDQTAGDVLDPTSVFCTIELAGSRLTTLAQVLTTESWPSDLTDKDWWSDHDPAVRKAIADYGAAAVTITDVTVKDSEGNTINRGVYDHILLEGQIHPWMTVLDIEGTVSGTVNVVVLGAKPDPAYPDAGNLQVEQRKEIRTFTLTLTNADANSGKTYRKVALAVSGESAPTNFAAALYAAWSQLQYQGSLTLHQSEALAATYFGRKVNVTGARSEWTTMAAIVQSLDEHLDTGRTVVTFGPARHISPDDLITLLRAVRARPVAYGWNLRVTGAEGAETQPAGGPVAKNQPAAAKAETLAITMADYTGTGGTIAAKLRLSPSDVKAAATYKVFQVQTDAVPGSVPSTVFDYLRAHS